MNVVNVVGMGTNEYIAKIHGVKTGGKMSTKTSKRKTVTPVENFKRKAGARLGRALYEIELLSKCVGAGFEKTDEQVDKAINMLLEAVSMCDKKLRAKPKTTAKAKQPKHFVRL